MIASLPMYLFPETQAAYERFWEEVRNRLRAQGIAAPEKLDYELSPEEAWGSPDLVLGHICNLPYRAAFKDVVTLIAASDYGLEGCLPGEYRALFVVRDDHPALNPYDLNGAAMAYSDGLSQSGWGAAAIWAEEHGTKIVPEVRTGGHVNSVKSVLEGNAEFATIDAQTFRILRKYTSLPDRLRVVGATDTSPGMSFVTRKGEDPAPYLNALRGALTALDAETRTILNLEAVVPLPKSAYDMPIPPTPGHIRTLMQG